MIEDNIPLTSYWLKHMLCNPKYNAFPIYIPLSTLCLLENKYYGAIMSIVESINTSNYSWIRRVK